MVLLVAALTFVASGQNREWMERMRAEHRLALPDWRPISNSVVPVTRVERARFPAVDVHTHISRPREEAEVRRVLSAMDSLNVRYIVHLTGSFGENLTEQLRTIRSVAGDRIVVCTQIDFKQIDEPDFSARMVQSLEEAHKAGARCLKISKVLGLYAKDKTGKYVAVNDPRLDPIWAKCGELKIPVLIHVADPIAFFRPWDEKNEAYAALWRNPDWWFHGKDAQGVERFTHEELMHQRDDILARHAKTQFVALHYASLSHDLGAVARFLDKYPNATVEMGARNWALGTAPNSGRKFALEYQDRILFGTDGSIEPMLYKQYFRTLETDDDQIVNVLPRSWGPIHGVHLPDPVLRKIYFENARKLSPFLK
jgi:predicted TIM-barrel fold metal-dependent hydrolase